MPTAGRLVSRRRTCGSSSSLRLPRAAIPVPPTRKCCANNDTFHIPRGAQVPDVARAAHATLPWHGLGVGAAGGMGGAHDGDGHDQYEPLSLAPAVLAIDQTDRDGRLRGRDACRARAAV